MPRIHPTAVVDASAELADDVEIGPHCVVEADVRIGAGTRLISHAVVRRYTRIGQGNVVHPGAVLGGEPQDHNFKPDTLSCVEIGDGCIFREGVTISRATQPGGVTRIGNSVFFMTNSHAGHDALVHDQAILVNGAVLAGYTELGRKAFVSAYGGVHQFCWVGSLVMMQAGAIATMHAPPFVTMANGINNVAGLNVVGMRRAGLSAEDRRQIQEAFSITYRQGLPPAKAIERMDARGDWGPAADQFRQFIRRVLEAKKPFHRGLCPFRVTRRDRGGGEE